MLTQILLSILILTIITFGTLTFLWWKKYGKKIFGLFDKLGTMKTSLNKKIPTTKNNDIDQLKNSLNMLSSLIGKIPQNGKPFKHSNQK
jgi:hypothetical protein